MMFATRLAALGILCLTLEGSPSWTFTGDAPEVGLGVTLAGLGDVDGDGYDDVALGTFDIGGDPAGRTFVFRGSPSGLSPTPSWIFPHGGTPSAALDVNGDGFQDLFIRRNDSKAAYLFLGSPYGLLLPPASTLQPGAIAQKILGLGDTTGDGFGDAALVYVPETGPHLTFLYGNAGGIGPPWGVLHIGDLADIAAAGDVNGDGLADIVLSRISSTTQGRISVLPGSPDLFNGAELWHTSAEGPGGFGTQVAGAGDVNGDGFDDFLVSARVGTGMAGEVGTVYLYQGAPSGPDLGPSWEIWGAHLVGTRIASAGDVDGDGYSDVVVSAGSDDVPTGVVLLYRGSPSGLSHTPDQVVTGGDEAVTFGWALGSAGDVDGDGTSELLVGDPFALGERGHVSLFRSPSPAGATGADIASRASPGACGALGAEVLLLLAAASLCKKCPTLF